MDAYLNTNIRLRITEQSKRIGDSKVAQLVKSYNWRKNKSATAFLVVVGLVLVLLSWRPSVSQLFTDDRSFDVTKGWYNNNYDNVARSHSGLNSKCIDFFTTADGSINAGGSLSSEMTISDIRVFMECFVTNPHSAKGDFLAVAKEIKRTMLQWSTDSLPVYKKLGKKFPEASIPSIRSGAKISSNPWQSTLYTLYHSFNGKGIVIPIKSQSDVQDVVKMAKVLRALKVKYPVQIVYAESLDSQDEVDLRNAFMSNIEPLEGSTIRDFPPIKDVWTVDIGNMVRDPLKGAMNNDDGKLWYLAAIAFSSFEDVILLDKSVVPMSKKLFKKLESREYRSTGSYFFPSLRLDKEVEVLEFNALEKWFPSGQDSRIFGMNRVGNAVLNSTRIFGERRAQEVASDVIMLNKKKHFTGLVIAMTLISKGSSKTLQDDMVWIGSLVDGSTSSLYKHPIPAGIVGSFTKNINRKTHKPRAKEICSRHRIHFDSLEENGKENVLFITNGVRNCDVKRRKLGKDINMKYYTSFNKDERKLEEHFQSRIDFNASIIPLRQEIKVESSILESPSSLVKAKMCNKSFWCAYDSAGGSLEDEFRSDVIYFSEEEAKRLEDIADLLM
ncbi:uncharacterized protein CYBJADRAFT_165116 [Cyberlindnera jadinii NRRL Y-1542]|uniref:Uncharacterized protein n=1 Tax=Cyberlindnera jadinii (strain ATCC 18201 / CBS 1600 / BCRC 20928 / JCM 3617 / NBRC 0987 / NRRL Y-1542) TaxID=983966 RepID=A0A1E4S883_CYBJN|nr:hypothetical protein CYBJADRAFT_165116 [Cyberlindnera jadinii NRRL Y-1542]ODV75688.1 hypothetical protein CYBJADRAFT_165116 [Cyberlindnera jadinii NRRL Y-1542]